MYDPRMERRKIKNTENTDSFFKIISIDEKMVMLWDIDEKYVFSLCKKTTGDAMPIVDYIRNNHKVGDIVKFKISLELL